MYMSVHMVDRVSTEEAKGRKSSVAGASLLIDSEVYT